MLAYDIAEVLSGDEYNMDVDSEIVLAALPAFLEALADWDGANVGGRE